MGTGLQSLRAVMGSITKNAQILGGQLANFQDKCDEHGIIYDRAPLLGHSIGVTTNDFIRNMPEIAQTHRKGSIGKMFNFGGPTQPTNAINYAATTDLIAMPSAMRAVQRGQSVVFIESGRQLPLKAHGCMGEAYREALYDAIYKRGMLDHE
jgi:hypothetical protein